MSGRWLGALALAGALWAMPGLAACIDNPASLASYPGELGRRFTVLRALDQESDPADKARQWQGIIDAGEKDAATPPGLLMESYAWLAWAQGSTVSDGEIILRTAQKAQAVAARAGLSEAPINAIPLAFLAIAELSLGHADQARDHEAQARRAALKLPGTASEDMSIVTFAHAYLAMTKSDYATAIADYRTAVAMDRQCLAPSNSRIVTDMSSLAGALDAAGAQEEALVANEQAAAWATEHLPADSIATSLSYNNLAVSLRNAGRLAEAETLMAEVLDREQKYEANDWNTRATALANYAQVINTQGRHEDAERLWQQSLDWHRKATAPNVIDPALSLRFAADAAEARGDFALAMARRKQAVAVLEPGVPTDHPDLAAARMAYARSLSMAGQSAAALALAESALAVVTAKLPPESVRRLGTEMNFAEVLANTQGAEAGYAAARPVAERMRAKLLDTTSSRGELVKYGPGASSAFATMVRLALETGRSEEAFQALQLANLSDIAVASREIAAQAAALDPAGQALQTAFQDRLRQRRLLDQQRHFATSAGDKATAARYAAELEQADHALAGLERELAEKVPSYRALARSSPVTLVQFRAGLGATDILIAPITTARATYVVAVTRQGLTWGKSALGGAAVGALVERIRGSIDAARLGARVRRFDRRAARELYDALIPAALRPRLAAHRSLQYFAPGRLASIPPALLIGPGQGSIRHADFLILHHDVTVLPTLAAALPARARRNGLTGHFLGVGAPQLAVLADLPTQRIAVRGGVVQSSRGFAFPALPRALGELTAMKASLDRAGGVLLTGATATEAALAKLPLASFDVIAFATHGVLAGEVPGLTQPALVLSTPATIDGDDDGMLTAGEIARMKLDADWVVLSACNTAQGGSGGSPEYAGLATAFVQAGARSLLVSHWPVRDDAAARLTVATLRTARQGVPRAIALQRAMIALMQDRSVPGSANPAVWAPFVLVGR